MSTSENDGDAGWEQIWNARMAGMSSILGRPADTVFHATVPFEFRDAGGTADVVPFPDYVPGMTYVTSELTGSDVGQIPNSHGHYELVICCRQNLPEAADFISRLACYTCDDVIEAGQTMDIGDFFGDSTLRAMVFSHLSSDRVNFSFLGGRYTLILCVGITAEELKFAHSHGTDELLVLLKKHGVFPYTVPGRPPVPLPRKGSVMGKLFGK